MRGVLCRMAGVLIVEDEVLIAMFIGDAVVEAGHTPIGPYAAVAPALSAIEREPICAALLDVNLGRGGLSYPVARALDRRGIPFAFLTGYSADSIDTAYRTKPVFSKPVAQHKLVEIVQALVAQSAGGG
jgi:DNA-binding response OmpR family regulator